jgi:hypothetical protein
VPVIGLIGGTKTSPLPILGRKGFALQEDNVALEYNIPAASSKYEWVYNLMRIREEIDARLEQKGLVPAIEASMRFTLAQLDHPQAKVFGCEPDYNVWEQKVNEKPSASPEAATLRTAGGHIHVGFNVGKEPPRHPDHIVEMESVVMGMDIFVGVPLAIMDKDAERRKMYGRAGAFRPKSYGIEYRVPSNFWTRSPELMGFIFEQVKHTINWVNSRKDPRSNLLEWKGQVEQAINNSDKGTQRYIMECFNIVLPGQTGPKESWKSW